MAERLGAAGLGDLSDQIDMQGPAAVQPGSEESGGSDTFGADTAHELANLVLVMSGSLEQLRRQPPGDQGRRQLARAEWSVRQAAQLTRRVLSQAQSGDGRPDVVDLNAAVSKLAAAVGRVTGSSQPNWRRASCRCALMLACWHSCCSTWSAMQPMRCRTAAG